MQDTKKSYREQITAKGILRFVQLIDKWQCFESLGCLSAVDVVEFNPAIGTDEEVMRTASNTMKLITILLGQESHLKHAPPPPVDEEKAGNGAAHWRVSKDI